MVRGMWWNVIVTLALVAILNAGANAASVVISPARIELEVAPEGSEASLTILNRGEERVAFSLFAGMGSHGADGSPLYFDHPEARVEADGLVALDPSFVSLDPGEMKTVRIQFAAAPGVVATYPVIFAEFQPVDEPTAAHVPSMRAVARLAVPVLLTYHATREERRVGFQIEEVRSNPSPDTGEVIVDVTVRNIGNVHEWVRGKVDLVGSDGISRGESLLPELRVLPGASRTLRAKLNLDDINLVSGIHLDRGGRDLRSFDPLHIVAVVYGDGWSSARAFHTLATDVAMAQPRVISAGEETAR